MLTNTLVRDGVSTCVVTFSNKLAERGHRVVVCGKDGPLREKLRPEVRFETVDFYQKTPGGMLRNLRQLLQLVKEEHIDAIHCHWRMTTLYARLLHMLKGVDVVWQNHLVPIPHDLPHRLMTYYGKKAIAISEESREFLRTDMRIQEGKIAVICNGIDTKAYVRLPEPERDALRRCYGIREGEKAVVRFARLDPVKGHGFLLQAAGRLEEPLRGSLKLLLTGDGTEEYRAELEAQSGVLGLQNQVVFTGNVRPQDILSIADVMCLPSQIEGQGIAALEAMAMKVPVIRTRTGGYLDMADYVDGVDYGDVDALAVALEKNLLGGPEFNARVERAYQKVRSDWDIETTIDKYEAIYQS